MAKKRQYDDDDGRTIADMSGVQRDNLIVPRLPKRRKGDVEQASESSNDAPQMDKQQRNAFIGGALSATLLIAGIFVAAGAILIFLLTTIWG
ncbi:MAG: hypothetical protein IJ766_06115 [Clostridia bacterium]|nr:hypothetical protein [Clostridia bacterium]